MNADRASDFYVERRRGSLLLWLPTKKIQWVREPINGDRAAALKRLIDRAAAIGAAK